MHRTMVIALALALGVAGRAGRARADRLPPHATQQAVLGCWDVGAGATLTLTAVGKHSVAAVARFSARPRGGPAVMRGRGRWSEAAQAYEAPCRPRSQHGSTCLVAPAAGGGLAVRVIAFGAGGRSLGVVETLTASRCAPPAP